MRKDDKEAKHLPSSAGSGASTAPALLAQYTLKADKKVQIQVFGSGKWIEVVEVGATKKKCAGKLSWKEKGKNSSTYIADEALILDSMFSRPKGLGIGAILVYEYSCLAKSLGRYFLGIDLVAAQDAADASPRGFYTKMGFWDTLDTAALKGDATFQQMPPASQQTALLSMPMSGATVLVGLMSAASWSKLWLREAGS